MQADTHGVQSNWKILKVSMANWFTTSREVMRKARMHTYARPFVTFRPLPKCSERWATKELWQCCTLQRQFKDCFVLPNVVTYSATISACSRGSQWQRALAEAWTETLSPRSFGEFWNPFQKNEACRSRMRIYIYIHNFIYTYIYIYHVYRYIDLHLM